MKAFKVILILCALAMIAFFALWEYGGCKQDEVMYTNVNVATGEVQKHWCDYVHL